MPLGAIDGRARPQLLEWTERALRGLEPLPRLTPDEAPDVAIARAEGGLSNVTRQDLRYAVTVLVRRLLPAIEVDDGYVAALLRLARSFNLEDVAIDLVRIARSAGFEARSSLQQASILGAILDLRAPVPERFWLEAARRSPRLGVLCFAAAARDAGSEAAPILALLPDEEPVADELYVVLGQLAEDLAPAQRERLAEQVGATHVAAAIKLAITEWLNEVGGRRPVPARRLENLDRAFRARSGGVFQPKPAGARIGAAAS